PCTISSGHLCTSPNICVNNLCATPTPTATPTPAAQPTINPNQINPFVRTLSGNNNMCSNWNSAVMAPDGSVWSGRWLAAYDNGNYGNPLIEIRKFRNDGSLAFTRTEQLAPGIPTSDLQLPVVLATADGGVLTVLTHWYNPTTHGRGSVIRKYTETGVLQWTLPLRAPGTYGNMQIWTAVEYNDSFILAGQSNGWSSSGSGIAFVTRISSSGTVQWARVISVLDAPASWGSSVNKVNVNTNGEITLLAISDQQGYTAGEEDAHFYRISMSDGTLLSAIRIGDANKELGLSFYPLNVAVGANVAAMPGGGFTWFHRQRLEFPNTTDRFVVLNGDGTFRRSYGAYSDSGNWYPSSIAGVTGDPNKIVVDWAPAMLDREIGLSIFNLDTNMTLHMNRKIAHPNLSYTCTRGNHISTRNGAFLFSTQCRDMSANPCLAREVTIVRSDTSGNIPSCSYMQTPEAPEIFPYGASNPAAVQIPIGTFNSFAVTPELATSGYVQVADTSVGNSCR
ncbi:MAG: hypothetical protein N2691_05930, partial [Patescibacteria group bacterium]|nr:hypothetical protein [Patescibacteria group bacterium]